MFGFKIIKEKDYNTLVIRSQRYVKKQSVVSKEDEEHETRKQAMWENIETGDKFVFESMQKGIIREISCNKKRIRIEYECRNYTYRDGQMLFDGSRQESKWISYEKFMQDCIDEICEEK
jgi:hypothetical protein